MLVIKIIVYAFIFLSSSCIGLLISRKYTDREKELKEFKKALNMFKTKIKFTYEPIQEIFNQISKNIDSNVGHVFKIASNNMRDYSADEAWRMALDIRILNIETEDLNILKDFSKLLGKTDIQGQISQIDLTNVFLDEQIQKATRERMKNEKLYRTLGMIAGLAIVIVLMWGMKLWI